MIEMDAKKGALKDILEFVSKLRGEKLKGKPVALEIGITTASSMDDEDEDQGISSKDKLKKALGLG